MIDRANIENLQMIVLYTGLLMMAVFGGGYAISYAQDFHLYNYFLSDWRLSVREHVLRGKTWPAYTPDDLLGYMVRVSRNLEQNEGVRPPKSGEPDRPFIYRFAKPNQPLQEIFLVAYPNWIRLYGVQPQTAERLDIRIDGSFDFNNGAFRAAPSDKNDGLLTVDWQLD